MVPRVEKHLATPQSTAALHPATSWGLTMRNRTRVARLSRARPSITAPRVTSIVKYLLWATLVVNQACVEVESDTPSESEWKVIRNNLLTKVPSPQYRVEANLNNKVTYLGLDVDKKSLAPGESFTMTHYWKVSVPVPEWRVFVHLNGRTRSTYLNADHRPMKGLYSPRLWKAGDIIQDKQSVTLPSTWASDRAKVYVGLWKGERRLTVLGGGAEPDGRILAATLKVNTEKAPRGKAVQAKRLIATRIKKPIILDGKLDEACWRDAHSSGAFVDTMTGNVAKIQTDVKALWDKEHLYIAFENVDYDIWGSMKNRDDKLWTEEAVEVFIDADGDQKDYIELQVSPNGVIFDSYLPDYRKNQNGWNSKMKASVSVDGTLSNRSDRDRAWRVELAIPWADIYGPVKKKGQAVLTEGDRLHINFFRLDKPKGSNQVAASWSPPLVGDFHRLNRFGVLILGDGEGRISAKRAKKDISKKK